MSEGARCAGARRADKPDRSATTFPSHPLPRSTSSGATLRAVKPCTPKRDPPRRAPRLDAERALSRAKQVTHQAHGGSDKRRAATGTAGRFDVNRGARIGERLPPERGDSVDKLARKRRVGSAHDPGRALLGTDLLVARKRTLDANYTTSANSLGSQPADTAAASASPKSAQARKRTSRLRVIRPSEPRFVRRVHRPRRAFHARVRTVANRR